MKLSTSFGGDFMLKTSKKILSIIMVVIMVLTAVPLSGFVGFELPAFDWGIKASALAESGQCGDNVSYTYDSETKELIIGGTGSMTDYGSHNSPFSNSDIESVVIMDGVTTIGSYTFFYCKSLTSITIPNSIISINHDAFSGCSSLKNMEIPDSVTAMGSYVFNNCKNLESVAIGKGIKEIPSGYFSGLTGLKSVALSEGLETIGDNAFSGCTYLEIINFPGSLKYMGKDILKNTAWYNYRGAGLIVYDNWVYGYKGEIPSNYILHLNSDIKGIAWSNFAYSKNIIDIEIDSNNSYFVMENSCLYNKDKTIIIAYIRSKGLSSFSIPNSVEEIFGYAFYYNDFSNIKIGDNVKKIGEYAFYYTWNRVKNVYITDLEAWCKIEFANESSNPLFNELPSDYGKLYVNNVEVSSIFIPDTIIELKPYVFYNCDNLISIALSDSVETIGNDAFNSCDNLIDITLSKNLKLIESNAFHHFSSKLKDVFYPGTQKEWDALSIGGNNNNLKNANLYLMHKHDYTITVTSQPTCTTTGTAFYECSLGDTKIEILPALGHTWDEGKITSNSSCNYGGTKIYTCTVCFDAKSETIATLDHDYQLSYSVEPTCTKDGYTVYQCTQCPSTDIRTTDAMLGHDWQTEFTVDIDSTCTKTGVKSKHCNRCSETTDETIVETKEHSWQTQQTITKTPTCIAEGEAATLCKDCKVVKTGSTVAIEPLGHNASEQEFTIDVAATCQSTGRMSKHCTRCNYTEQATIIPTATHDYHIASSSTATCYEGGKAIYVCEGCGDWYIVENSDALGHDYDYLIVESPTCKREGIKTGVCIRCGDADTRSVDKIDHDYVRTEVSPTCLDDGLATYTCSYGCGTTYDETLPALGHSYPANWTNLMNATCSDRGLKVKVCKTCGDIASQVLPKLEHFDGDGNGVCDTCENPDTPNEPDIPDEPDTPDVPNTPNEPDVPEDPSANCSCNCHKSGLSKILFNIILFFQKLLRSNKTCICGVSHY